MGRPSKRELIRGSIERRLREKDSLSIREIQKEVGGSHSTISGELGRYLGKERGAGQGGGAQANGAINNPVGVGQTAETLNVDELASRLEDRLRKGVSNAHDYSMSKIEQSSEKLMELVDTLKHALGTAQGGSNRQSERQANEMEAQVCSMRAQIDRLIADNLNVIKERDRLRQKLVELGYEE